MVGVAAIAGIGFTVSLFIAVLAFDDQQLVDEAKMAVLVAIDRRRLARRGPRDRGRPAPRPPAGQPAGAPTTVM